MRVLCNFIAKKRNIREEKVSLIRYSKKLFISKVVHTYSLKGTLSSHHSWVISQELLRVACLDFMFVVCNNCQSQTSASNKWKIEYFGKWKVLLNLLYRNIKVVLQEYIYDEDDDDDDDGNGEGKWWIFKVGVCVFIFQKKTPLLCFGSYKSLLSFFAICRERFPLFFIYEIK